MAFRELSPENWLEPDPVSRLFVAVGPDGAVRPISCDRLASALFRPALSADVPAATRDLFEVARGAMLYGWFFYPLYALGLEQVHRVSENAATLRAKELGRRVRSFSKAIDALTEAGLLDEKEKVQWDAMRRLRNAGSHPQSQTLLPPGEAIGLLSRTADRINALWSRSGQ